MPEDALTTAREAQRQPSISVVIPTRGSAPGLARLVARLIAQRYDGTVEIIVVIDGSSDVHGLRSPPSLSGTLRRAVRTVRNTQDPGLEGARRTGRLAAEGELVLFCDDDEEWPPDRLRELVVRRFAARRVLEAGNATVH